MFLKPFRIKSQTAIKGSDRKKLRQTVCRAYPNVDEDQAAEMIPQKEDMSVLKIYTHSGETAVVYVLKKNPIFFEADDSIFPTVYTTWKYPDMMPMLTTFPDVHKRIVGGADLMLPGVIIAEGQVTPHTFGHLRKRARCGVKLLGNKSPVAVGRTALSGSDMYESAMKGKGVVIVHFYKDQLWAHGDKSDPPHIIDPEFALDPMDFSEIADPIEPLPNSPENAVPSSSGEKVGKLMEGLTLEEKQTSASSSDAEEDTPQQKQSVQDRMDELLMWCFKCALKLKVAKSDLPLLTSTFQRNCLQACCPNDKYLDLKKTSYKKLSKFLAAMQTAGYIKMKKLKEGVDSITEINKDQPDLRRFKVDESDLPIQEASDTEETVEVFSYEPPQISDVYLVTTNVQEFFKPYGHNKGTSLSAQAIRTCLNEYVRTNNMQDENRKGFVKMDPLLAHMVQKKDDYRELLRWEDITAGLLAKMTTASEITFPGQKPRIMKKKLDPIVFETARRMGNKKVTLVDGLEDYGIDPALFAHQVQVGVSVSTSLAPSPAKKAGVQVTVQGNQITFITKLLTEKYKLPKKWLQGIDKAPGKKKK